MEEAQALLTDTVYSAAYYEEHRSAGLDYLAYGEWHRSYATAVTAATLQDTYPAPFVVDAGTACGTILKGFSETGTYVRVLGVDICAHMVELGRAHLGFSKDQLVFGSIDRLPIPDGSATLIHSGQVLEHIPADMVERIFGEFFRVLCPGGRMFHNLAALKHGEPPNYYDGDPTHINVKPTLYWAERFASAGFIPDFESYDRFARSPNSPGQGYQSFYSTYSVWTIFAYIKPMTHVPEARQSSF